MPLIELELRLTSLCRRLSLSGPSSGEQEERGGAGRRGSIQDSLVQLSRSLRSAILSSSSQATEINSVQVQKSEPGLI